jgi:2-dehydro-3-deoxyphosphogluconate aldolase/(4S)-4-hydroxy-2-oxoglutarate aldolase
VVDDEAGGVAEAVWAEPGELAVARADEQVGACGGLDDRSLGAAVGQENARRAAEALLRGGVDVVEVTLNTAGATTMIRELVAHFGERLLVGAGTVLSPSAVHQALDAGARFVVAPNTDPRVIAVCNRQDVPVVPGAFTPTEVVAAWETGADLVKVFPVSSVGPRYIRDLCGPLPDIPLVPTGGVTAENAADFVRAGAVAVGAGSDLVDRAVVDRGDFHELERRARAFIAAVGSRQ